MIESTATRSTFSPFALAISTVMLAGHLQYPVREAPYVVEQELGTHSDFIENLENQAAIDKYEQEVAEIYNTLLQSQQSLGAEFEAAIFSDLESLYEA